MSMSKMFTNLNDQHLLKHILHLLPCLGWCKSLLWVSPLWFWALHLHHSSWQSGENWLWCSLQEHKLLLYAMWYGQVLGLEKVCSQMLISVASDGLLSLACLSHVLPIEKLSMFLVPNIPYNLYPIPPPPQLPPIPLLQQWLVGIPLNHVYDAGRTILDKLP